MKLATHGYNNHCIKFEEDNTWSRWYKVVESSSPMNLQPQHSQKCFSWYFCIENWSLGHFWKPLFIEKCKILICCHGLHEAQLILALGAGYITQMSCFSSWKL
jgi:hypothetical protein